MVTTCEGIDVKKIDQCIGDPDADVDNLVLKTEQEAQVLILTDLILLVCI